jgi:hypothetical protein
VIPESRFNAFPKPHSNMVKLKGPSLSTAAAGGLGKTLIFAESKGRRYAKKWHQPANPKTKGQVAMRAMVRFLSQQWSLLSAADQATWEARAAATVISPFNAYQAFNLERWRRFQGPTQHLPTDVIFLPAILTYPTLSQVGRFIQFDGTVTDERETWAMLFYNVASAGAPPSWRDIIHFLDIPAAGSYTWRWGPLTPGTYYFRLSLTQIHGFRWTGAVSRQLTVT